MKRLIWNVFGVATGLVALSGFAVAQGLSQDSAQGMQLMAGNTELLHTLDTKSAAPGQNVAVKLTSSIETPQGVKLPGGTELLGRVESVKAYADNSPATLVLTFNQAHLKDGKTLAIKATLISVASADSSNGLPMAVGPDGAFEQEPGGLGAVALHSAVQQNVSGTLTDARHNIKLQTGTQLLVAVGVESSGQSAAGAN